MSGRSTKLQLTQLESLEREPTEFTQSVTIAPSKPIIALPVDVNVWERIKSAIDEIEENSNFYNSSFFGFFGATISALIFLVTISPEEKRPWIFTLAWVMFLVTIILCIISLAMGYRESTRINKLRGKLRRDMEAFEEQFVLTHEDEAIRSSN